MVIVTQYRYYETLENDYTVCIYNSYVLYYVNYTPVSKYAGKKRGFKMKFPFHIFTKGNFT